MNVVVLDHITGKWTSNPKFPDQSRSFFRKEITNKIYKYVIIRYIKLYASEEDHLK